MQLFTISLLIASAVINWKLEKDSTGDYQTSQDETQDHHLKYSKGIGVFVRRSLRKDHEYNLTLQMSKKDSQWRQQHLWSSYIHNNNISRRPVKPDIHKAVQRAQSGDTSTLIPNP